MSRTVERAAATAAGDSDEGHLVGPGLFWIKNFCAKAGNEMFVEIDEDYILDRFNLTGIGHEVAFAQKSYDYITRTASEVEDEEDEDEEDEEDEEESSSSSPTSTEENEKDKKATSTSTSTKTTTTTKARTPSPPPQKGKPSHEKVLQGSRMLYGLIHSRYILDAAGMAKMKEKYIQGAFRQCPRVFCHNQGLLPIGLSDQTKVDSLKLFCARCGDVYNPRTKRHLSLDGAYWGTTFAHLFRQNYPNLFKDCSAAAANDDTDNDGCRYVPRIFGYKISTKSQQQ